MVSTLYTDDVIREVMCQITSSSQESTRTMQRHVELYQYTITNEPFIQGRQLNNLFFEKHTSG